MYVTVLSGLRKDGKYKVRLYFLGATNMFGGRYPGRSFTKLYTPEKLRETLAHPGLTEATNVPDSVYSWEPQS